jgi:hypothetical protein
MTLSTAFLVPQPERMFEPVDFDWAASNARLEQSAANTTALIEQMRADHAADAKFQERWNAMSYQEALAFQATRTVDTPAGRGA